MPIQDRLIEQFLGGDPIAGTSALRQLVAYGGEAEEALFSGPLEYPKTAQVARRWLRYVASREQTVVRRLLGRLQNQDEFGDAHTAAYLFSGTSSNLV